MRRAGRPQPSRFLQPEVSTEGCDWTVFVNLAAVAPRASACPVVELPRNVTELRSARYSCERVARSIAAKMNKARDTH
jgi:hypothetical protein